MRTVVLERYLKYLISKIIQKILIIFVSLIAKFCVSVFVCACVCAHMFKDKYGGLAVVPQNMFQFLAIWLPGHSVVTERSHQCLHSEV